MPKTEIINNLIEDLIEDLEEEKCVLLLGPEVIQVEGKSLIRHTHEALLSLNREDILYYYEQDSLFLFKDANAKLNAPRQVKRVYRNLRFEDDVLRKILEIPFHLIISLNPDQFLSETAVSYGIPHHFKYFRFNGENASDIPVPDKYYPLIYNLCGCIKEDESLLLDYEDLFLLLRSILGPNSLPSKIRKKLREARSFLFLGFDFEKWYTQLLLQLLTGERKGSRKLAMDTNLKGGAARDFLLFQFNIEFFDKGHSFFESLYQQCRNQKLLRKLKEPIQINADTVAKIKALVADNQLSGALGFLERATVGTELYDETLLLSGRHKDWNRKYHGGTLFVQEAHVLINQIREDLLTLTSKIL